MIIPKRAGIGIDFLDNFCFDEVSVFGLNILGNMRMPIIITTRVSISVIDAKKNPNIF